ncbi:DoxX family protein [Gloeobacter morelensis]|uniref:DoxX family protein n=1 Tax=Gloeobacter morelensis MG652769 TaxID=2781736 RepID=A0ABY3PQP4_9CYAN|nr:DoxX family protein [Gloeobacter morelensis]UFP96023.1 DoxX family protein [Gloeobacter morelensis MG652769]
MNRILALLIGGYGGAAPLADVGLLVLRVFAGLTMASHGLGKVPPDAGLVETVASLGFAAPVFFAWSAGLAELVGGILLAVGLLTRPAAAAILFTMLVAGFILHGSQPFAEKELALLYAAVSFAFLLAGAGRFSLDGWIGERLLGSSAAVRPLGRDRAPSPR